MSRSWQDAKDLTAKAQQVQRDVREELASEVKVWTPEEIARQWPEGYPEERLRTARVPLIPEDLS